MTLPNHVRAPRWSESGLRVWRADSWSRHEKPIREMIEDTQRLPYWLVCALLFVGALVTIWAVT